MVTLKEDYTPNTILYLDGVSVSFDGFKALNNLSLYVEPGELRAIIGPNGAGKTTMMDVITGKLRPDTGEVFFQNLNLLELDEAEIANLGIGRKFQKPTVFESLSVLDNLELALKMDRSPWAVLLQHRSPEVQERMDAVLEQIGLQHRRQELAGALSHGQKQWLEIGMLMMQDLELLLVDEPVAGMTDAETEQTAALLQQVSGERSVIVVEHDMEFVRSLGGRVTVLHEGSVLAEGSHADVSSNEQVVEVYLGR
jgi:urea transport system ATP-binding protein